MEDLTNYSRSQLSTAYTIEKEIKPGLVAFSEVEMVKQVSGCARLVMEVVVVNTPFTAQHRALYEKMEQLQCTNLPLFT